jgi:hypothetical protein
MKLLYRGIAVAVLQCLLVLSLAGKYAFDRDHLPRVWVRAVPVVPNLPMRGRYVRLNLELDVPPQTKSGWLWATLSVRQGRLFAKPVSFDTGLQISPMSNDRWGIVEPIAFFIPARLPDPSRRPPGEELWAEVSVPGRGKPRPIRLAVRKNGVLTPLQMR